MSKTMSSSPRRTHENRPRDERRGPSGWHLLRTGAGCQDSDDGEEEGRQEGRTMAGITFAATEEVPMSVYQRLPEGTRAGRHGRETLPLRQRRAG